MEGFKYINGFSATPTPKITKGDDLIGTVKGDRILQVPEVTFKRGRRNTASPWLPAGKGMSVAIISYYDDSLSAKQRERHHTAAGGGIHSSC